MRSKRCRHLRQRLKVLWNIFESEIETKTNLKIPREIHRLRERAREMNENCTGGGVVDGA